MRFVLYVLAWAVVAASGFAVGRLYERRQQRVRVRVLQIEIEKTYEGSL